MNVWTAAKLAASARLSPLRARLRRHATFRILGSAGRGFLEGRLPSHAAAMAYYGVFSLFPLMLLAMGLAGLALGAEEARSQITGVVTELLPRGQAAIGALVDEVVETRGTAAGFGIVTLAFSGLAWFCEFDADVNEIWGVTRRRSRLQGVLLPVGLALASGAVALLSLAATTAVDVAVRLMGAVPGVTLFASAAASLLGVLTMAGIFVLLYRYTPQGHVRLADVWPAGAGAAVVWELTRRLLAVYLETSDLVSGHGSIGAGMALLFWIYLAGIIVLAGAGVAHATALERQHGAGA